MSLNENDRQIVVKLQMDKARLFLEQADQMCKQHYWDIASNRYYYACFHAIQALFIHNGVFHNQLAGVETTPASWFITPR